MSDNLIQDQQFRTIEDAGGFFGPAGTMYDHCEFVGCHFQGADLSGVILLDCRFRNCDLSLALVQEARFNQVLFEGCKINGVVFDGCKNFTAMSFRDCRLEHCSFAGLKAAHAVFEHCSLLGTDFSAAQLKASSFKDSDLQGAVFDHTNLSKADFTGARNYHIDPVVNLVKGAVFSRDGLAGLLSSFRIKIVP